MRSLSILLACTLTTVVVAGCGVAPNAANVRNGVIAAQAAKKPQSLSAVYEVINNAGEWTYKNLDLNSDDHISEAEAQTAGLPDATFGAADYSHDSVLTHEEFGRWYATKIVPGCAEGVRKHLADDFAKLDKNKDGFLSQEEVGIPTPTPANVLGHPIGLELDGTTLVTCPGFNAVDFKSADETKDGKLVRAEFEDLWALSIKRRLNVK
ncbi:MAG: hypothetical protein JWM80_2480 [Cyanobacteria bacterium RYN_339]|nr:hypothetical protein [Cyanobacteria bacterium RYN_339]